MRLSEKKSAIGEGKSDRVGNKAAEVVLNCSTSLEFVILHGKGAKKERDHEREFWNAISLLLFSNVGGGGGGGLGLDSPSFHQYNSITFTLCK